MPYQAAAAALLIALLRTPAAAVDVAQRIAWQLNPSAHYAADVRMTHVIANDLKGIYKKLAGSKADPVTILEDRSVDVATGRNGSVNASTVDVRRYGALQAKDTTTMRRTVQFKGGIAPTGVRTPSDEPLADAGDGPLTQLPSEPVAPGKSWTFSRRILIDRELGQGTMTYTDTLQRVEEREGHRIAIIAVKGNGRVDVASDLKAKGFTTADMTFGGTAEFDLTSGAPGAQHYTAHVQWNTRVLWVHLGLVFDDTYDATPWTLRAR